MDARFRTCQQAEVTFPICPHIAKSLSLLRAVIDNSRANFLDVDALFTISQASRSTPGQNTPTPTAVPKASFALQLHLEACPLFDGKIHIHNSAVATFYVPSDPSGLGGMCREYLQATPSWRKGPARYDCAFLTLDPNVKGMLTLMRQSIFLSRVAD